MTDKRHESAFRMREDFYEMALKRSKKSDCLYKHCAVIVKKNRIISIGHNRRASPMMKREGQHTIHAEHDAIRRAKEDLRGASMYIMRFNKHGNARLSKPCVRCIRRIYRSGITKVYYSVSSDGELIWCEL